MSATNFSDFFYLFVCLFVCLLRNTVVLRLSYAADRTLKSEKSDILLNYKNVHLTQLLHSVV